MYSAFISSCVCTPKSIIIRLIILLECSIGNNIIYMTLYYIMKQMDKSIKELDKIKWIKMKVEI